MNKFRCNIQETW